MLHIINNIIHNIHIVSIICNLHLYELYKLNDYNNIFNKNDLLIIGLLPKINNNNALHKTLL